MNRKQRRDKAKRHQEQKRDVYAQIQHREAVRAVELKTEEIREYLTDKVTRNVVMAAGLALRDELGFSKSRLERFYRKFTEINDDIAAGRLTYSDIMDTLKEETGFGI